MFGVKISFQVRKLFELILMSIKQNLASQAKYLFHHSISKLLELYCSKSGKIYQIQGCKLEILEL